MIFLLVQSDCINSRLSSSSPFFFSKILEPILFVTLSNMQCFSVICLYMQLFGDIHDSVVQ